MPIDFRDLPAYRWMTDDTREEGLDQGRQEGLQLAVINVIEKNFPDLSRRAQKQLALVHHIGPLTKLLTRLYKAETPDDVKRYLSDALNESLELDY